MKTKTNESLEIANILFPVKNKKFVKGYIAKQINYTQSRLCDATKKVQKSKGKEGYSPKLLIALKEFMIKENLM